MPSGTPRDTEPDIPDWVNPPPPPPAEPAPLGAMSFEKTAEKTEQETQTRGVDPTMTAAQVSRRRTIDAADLAEWDRSRAAARRPRASGRGRRVLLIVGIALAVVVLVLAGGLLWVNGHLSGKGGSAVSVTLPDHAGHATLASDLSRAKVISDSWLFKRYLDYRGYPPVQGGKYTLHLHEGYRNALHDIGLGPQVTETRLTIPEGYDLQQIAAAVGALPGLSAQKFLSLATSGAIRSPYEPAGINSLEGLLFPDTYFVSANEDEQTILQAMINRFDQIGDEIGLSAAAQATGLAPYQTIIVASLVEKEAKLEVDRGKIARVILNRLGANMKLQIDATVDYAEGVHKTRLLDSDLATNSPYNTYLVAGLPPGPIASPGEASLQAALAPTPGSWLYYVLIDADGQHAFATTPAEFDQLKAEAQAKGLL